MEIKTYAPVIIPTLNRYDHFRQCLESLEKCVGADMTNVYVGLDYPPAEKYVEGWKKIDAYLKDKVANCSFKNLFVFRRDHNYGAFHSASNDAALRDYVTKYYDRWIFSEDDNIFSPNFLLYMNTCLEKYHGDPDVVQISGYTYPVHWKVSGGATCLKENVCFSAWGAGFWVDKYSKIQEYIEADELKHKLGEVIRTKSYKKMIDAATEGYFPAMCSYRGYKKKGKDPWRMCCDFVCRCYLAIENKYVVSPVISKVRNLGFDGSGITCQTTNEMHGEVASTYNYNEQPLDKSDTFELIEDTLCDDVANRDILSAFDYRSPEQMRRAKQLIWICEHIGLWAAELYQRTLQPFELAKTFYEIKLKR